MAKKKSVFALTTKDVVVMGIGSVLYAVLTAATNFIPLAGVSFRPAVAILVFLGVFYGPVVAFVSGTVGALIMDLIYGSVWLHWNIGNGLMGLFIGLVWLTRNYEEKEKLTFGDYAYISLFTIIGCFVGMIFAGLIDVIMGTPFSVAVVTWSLPAAISNSIFGIILGPLLIMAYKARSKPNQMDIQQ